MPPPAPPPPIPPPPAPPPPRPPPTVPQSLELKRDTRSRKMPCLFTPETSDELCQKDFRDKLNRIIYKHDALKSKKSVYLSLQRIAPALLQEGPQCGIIALAMAHKFMGLSTVDVDTIMTRAVQNNYTLQGEMFSASNMSKLAEEIYHCKSEILDMQCDSSRDQLIQYLLSGSPVLVPYDADFNHEPCKKKGHKAHWALLTGMLMIFDKQSTSNHTVDAKMRQNEINYDTRLLKNPSVTDKTQPVITDNISIETRSGANNDITSPVEDTNLDSLINGMVITNINPESEDCTDSAQPLVDIQIASPNKTGTSKSTGILEQASNLTTSHGRQKNNSEIIQTDFVDCNSLVDENQDEVSPVVDYDVSSVLRSANNVDHKQESESQNASFTNLRDSLENCAIEDYSLLDINTDAFPPIILLESTDQSSVAKSSQNIEVRNCDTLLNVDQGSSYDKVSPIADISTDKPLQDSGVDTTNSTLDIGYGSTNQITDSVSPLMDIGIENSLHNCDTTHDATDLLDTSHLVPRHSLDKVSPLADFGISKPENNLSPPVTNGDSTSPLLDTAVTSSSINSQPNDKSINSKIAEKSVDVVDSDSINCETFPIEDVHLSDVENLQGKTSKNTSLTHIEQILQELSIKASTPDVKFLIQDSDVKQLYHIDPDYSDQVKFSPVEYSKIYVYGCQGKSRRQAIWPLDWLLESNGNLFEINPEMTDEPDMYVLPSEGIDKELCNKIVILKK